MKKTLIVILAIFIVGSVVYLTGPTFPEPILSSNLPVLNIAASDVEMAIQNKEETLTIKPDNQSHLYWANDSLKNKTAYCLLYLHGFSASWYEGKPVHLDFARRYGMNLYAPLLASHGLVTSDPLLDMTPDRLYESAKEALVMAHILGEKVIIMSTSTGGTLSLKLASEFPEMVDGLILMSPNIAINNPAAFLLHRPWGVNLAKLAEKGDYRVTNTDTASEDCHYWNCKYRVEAVVYLQQLVNATMNEATFSKVNVPLLLAYYYKDEEHQDKVVKVDAMLNMYNLLGTPEGLKQQIAFPNAGTHTIGSQLFSKSWQEVENASFVFAEEKLGLVPVIK